MQVTQDRAHAFAQARATLDAVRAEDSTELYVINQADLPDSRNRSTQRGGTILFRCTAKGQTKDSLIRIPESFVPVNLTVQGPCKKEDLLESSDLHRLLQTKRVRLITAHDANIQINMDADSLIEYDRVMTEALKIDVDETQSDTPAQVELTVINNDLSVAIAAYKDGQISLPRLRATYRRIERQLKAEDISYASREVPELLQ